MTRRSSSVCARSCSIGRSQGKCRWEPPAPRIPAAFARAVAGTLDPASTRQEGYRSNFSGDYLEAAEYFGGVQDRITGSGLSADELSLNLALQQSNLGNVAAADRLFAESADVIGDPLLGRLRRNYLALHLLNQGRTDEAIAEARRSIGGEAGSVEGNLAIDDGTARRLNSDSRMAQSFGRQDPPPLTRAERIAILDAQAAHVAGAALRLNGPRDGGTAGSHAGVAGRRGHSRGARRLRLLAARADPDRTGRGRRERRRSGPRAGAPAGCGPVDGERVSGHILRIHDAAQARRFPSQARR